MSEYFFSLNAWCFSKTTFANKNGVAWSFSVHFCMIENEVEGSPVSVVIKHADRPKSSLSFSSFRDLIEAGLLRRVTRKKR